MDKYLKNSSIYKFVFENGTAVNLLIFMGFLLFVIITLDFDTELSVQRDEITYVVATLNNSVNTLDSGSNVSLIIDPPQTGVVQLIIPSFKNNDQITLPDGRAPPVSS